MGKKKIKTVLKLQCRPARRRRRRRWAPRSGPHGINIMEFTKAYNERTGAGRPASSPREITIYEDRSFTFIIKTPPAVDLLKGPPGSRRDRASRTARRSDASRDSRCARSPRSSRQDLNAYDVEHAMKIIEGTARSMGLNVN